MLLLTVKHIIADFMLQNSWMAIGKDQKTGWALPLLAHCLVHLAVSLLLIMVVAPRFWFVAFIDFAIHITVDRLKGICASSFGVTLERASLVLDADRRRPGAAPPHRFRPVDLHGRRTDPAQNRYWRPVLFRTVARFRRETTCLCLLAGPDRDIPIPAFESHAVRD